MKRKRNIMPYIIFTSIHFLPSFNDDMNVYTVDSHEIDVLITEAFGIHIYTYACVRDCVGSILLCFRYGRECKDDKKK